MKQHKIKSSTRENDAIKKCSKPETCAFVAALTRHTVYSNLLFFNKQKYTLK